MNTHATLSLFFRRYSEKMVAVHFAEASFNAFNYTLGIVKYMKSRIVKYRDPKENQYMGERILEAPREIYALLKAARGESSRRIFSTFRRTKLQ